jgi:hypothetical protein
MSISFLIPSRGRLELLKKTISSIIFSYEFSLDFDVLIRMDFDESQLCDDLLLWARVNNFDQYIKIFCGGRYFYQNIHLYFTELSFLSNKKWLWLWNDECLMVSKGWDKIISPHLNDFKFIFPINTSSFHLCPRKIVEIIGYYAPVTHCDSWQGRLATDLDLVQWIDISIVHDRYDLTGNNLDQTFIERNYINNDQSNISNNIKELEIIKAYINTFGFSV